MGEGLLFRDPFAISERVADRAMPVNSLSSRGQPRTSGKLLAIPAASVSVERLFSCARHLRTDLRCSFKAETATIAIVCMKIWIKQGLLQPVASISVKSTVLSINTLYLLIINCSYLFIYSLPFIYKKSVKVK